ncbi:MAG: hypothetical protein IJ725_00095 [Ruminococcus sp.]|nr:hypothetical protein [Ruminococcus sp.]
MTKRTRIIALLLAAAVLFVMLFSLFVIAAEAQHNCHGDDCPICELVALCENLVKGLSLTLVIITLIVALALMRRFCKEDRECGEIRNTPVLLKVKLTN